MPNGSFRFSGFIKKVSKAICMSFGEIEPNFSIAIDISDELKVVDFIKIIFVHILLQEQVIKRIRGGC